MDNTGARGCDVSARVHAPAGQCQAAVRGSARGAYNRAGTCRGTKGPSTFGERNQSVWRQVLGLGCGAFGACDVLMTSICTRIYHFERVRSCCEGT